MCVIRPLVLVLVFLVVFRACVSSSFNSFKVVVAMIWRVESSVERNVMGSDWRVSLHRKRAQGSSLKNVDASFYATGEEKEKKKRGEPFDFVFITERRQRQFNSGRKKGGRENTSSPIDEEKRKCVFFALFPSLLSSIFQSHPGAKHQIYLFNCYCFYCLFVLHCE